MLKYSVLVCCCCCLALIRGFSQEKSTSENILLNDIFVNKIDIRVRPTKTFEPLKVWIDYVLVSLLNINQREQLLTLNGRVVMKWLDKNISWNPYQHPIRYLVIKADKIWHPSLIILNSADNVFGDIFDHDKFRAQLHHTGLVVYFTSGVTTTFCQLDLTYFPYDAQACYMELSSFFYTEQKLQLQNMSNQVSLKQFQTIGQWELTRSKVTRFRVIRKCDRLSVVRFTFYLRRKPLYYIVTLVIPCTIASFLITMVYILPPESNEKISLSITTLLAFSVFQLNVSDNTPKTSQYIPVIAIYILFVQFFAALSLITSIFILRLNHHHDIKAPSSLLQRFTFNVIAKMIIRPTFVLKVKSNCRDKSSYKFIKRYSEMFKRKSICLLNMRNLLIKEKKKEILTKFSKTSSRGDHDDDEATLRKLRARNLWKKCVGLVLADLAENRNDKVMKLNSKIFVGMLKKSNEDSEEEREIKLLWSNIVNTFDQFFFIVYILIDVLACLIIFVIIPIFAPKFVEPVRVRNSVRRNRTHSICKYRS